MSDSVSRVQRYYDDAVRLLATINDSKITQEVKKLRQWLQKHQQETLPDGAKGKLMSTVEAYYIFCTKRPTKFDDELGDSIQNLVGDFLKIPEGKLINGKQKLKALKWFESTSVSSSSGKGKFNTSSTTKKWTVCDIDESGMLMLLSNQPGSDNIIEDFSITDTELLGRIRECFDSEGTVTIELDANHAFIKAIITNDGGLT